MEGEQGPWKEHLNTLQGCQLGLSQFLSPIRTLISWMSTMYLYCLIHMYYSPLILTLTLGGNPHHKNRETNV